MGNDEIVDALELLVKLWDVHGVNEFKSKNLAFAARGLDKYPGKISSLSESELLQIPGVGKSIVKIILDLIQVGSSSDLDGILEQTPPGILNLLKIKGLGPKKVGLIWKEMGITDLDDLLTACEENRLEQLKGFGKAVQENVQIYIQFLKQNTKKLRLDKATHLSQIILEQLKSKFSQVAEAGDLSRNCEVISELVFLVESTDIFGSGSLINSIEGMEEDIKESSPFTWRGFFHGHLLAIQIHVIAPDQWENALFQQVAHTEHLTAIQFYKHFQGKSISSDKEVYDTLNLPYIIPEMREGFKEFEWSQKYQSEELIQYSDLKGCLHNHSTYSDGKNTLLEMAEACRAQGLQYFGIADHSQYAAYANGLKEDRVIAQQEEIDQLNAQWNDFCILKGIEADILPDGSLDYDASVLARFDYVVASVHAQLAMDIDRSMPRVIKAIENPYTSILGHPTGRLLLTRAGFPLHMDKILDACKANGVSIELNASPYRLDLDWRYIYDAMDKGIYVSINPDAHQIEGIRDMEYGVKVGRKGGLLRSLTLNALNIQDLKTFFKKA
ncbi:helix-hairpin-helix domain-containing protein [Aquirufa aurantiipilula]|uniref:Helix-hairpin-helix domain-containing protein n=1 Tax=Aquirufa aurantiipilula TaxID=2696561 RepID=A0ABT6BHR9_9BACT|nr:helix-hairpin-helix domain-containing protein [Aquirufa aurantiipilula]MDF5690006.1 helix-hairpin-helix domain-containing protein [Aquirufa aurantiipilula]